MLKGTKPNVTKLRIPKALSRDPLSKSSNGLKIPQTIADAMEVLQRAGTHTYGFIAYVSFRTIQKRKGRTSQRLKQAQYTYLELVLHVGSCLLEKDSELTLNYVLHVGRIGSVETVRPATGLI